MSITGFKTKKALKEAVKLGPVSGRCLIETSIFGSEKKAGRHAIVGPSPILRNWWAEIELDANLDIVKVS